MSYTFSKMDGGFYTGPVSMYSVLATDTLATAQASAYLDLRVALLKQYDLIYIRGSDGAAWCHVSSVTGVTPVTVDVDSVLYGNNHIVGNDAKTAYMRFQGRSKFDNRPTGGSADDYNVQLRMESAKTSGSVWGLDGELHMKATGTASMRGVQGVAVLDATYTATDATYIGSYAQARADGTFTGSGFLAASYALIEASAAITASHVCSQWLDSHQANAVTGSHQFAYWTNNGAAVMDEALYLYAGNNVTAFVNFDTCGGMVATAAGETMTITDKIKVIVNGAVRYIQVGTMA